MQENEPKREGIVPALLLGEVSIPLDLLWDCDFKGVLCEEGC